MSARELVFYVAVAALVLALIGACTGDKGMSSHERDACAQVDAC